MMRRIRPLESQVFRPGAATIACNARSPRHSDSPMVGLGNPILRSRNALSRASGFCGVWGFWVPYAGVHWCDPKFSELMQLKSENHEFPPALPVDCSRPQYYQNHSPELYLFWHSSSAQSADTFLGTEWLIRPIGVQRSGFVRSKICVANAKTENHRFSPACKIHPSITGALAALPASK